MDGYAVRGADTTGANEDRPRLLAVTGTAKPARHFAGTVGQGEAVAVATGSPIPPGADAVVAIEVTHLEGTRVLVRNPVAPRPARLPRGRGRDGRGRGAAGGETAEAAGRRLVGSPEPGEDRGDPPPAWPSWLLGMNCFPGSALTGTAIIDSNSPMLAALTARDGGECLATRYVPDDRPTIRAAIRDAIETADVVLVTGGSSVGPEDHTPEVAAELGELAVYGIAMRPGSPAGIAFLPRHPAGSPQVPLFLLPGNPVACLCTYDLLAGRVVRRLGSRSWDLPYRQVSLPLASAITSIRGRTDYLRVRVESRGVVPIAAGGASILSSVVFADGFVLVPGDRDKLEAGEMVEVWMYG